MIYVDLVSGCCMEFFVYCEKVNFVVFFVNGCYVFIGGNDYYVYLWDIKIG